MHERGEQPPYSANDIEQLLTEVSEMIKTPPPESVPPYEADNFTLPLFSEEAPTDFQRYHAHLFISGTLFPALSIDTHWQKDQPAQFPPEELIKQHATHMEHLSAMYKRTDRRFSLTHLLGAVKREYGRVRYLQTEQGRSAQERIIFDRTAATYQTMQNLVVVARRRAGEQGCEGE
jgi:hypothetical protein